MILKYVCLFSSKFWTRNRPGDSLRDKYNLNTLPIGPDGEVIEGNVSLEPNHTKTCLQAYADSEGPDQPTHPCTRIGPSLAANRIIGYGKCPKNSNILFHTILA